jgi:hypothetical protein
MPRKKLKRLTLDGHKKYSTFLYICKAGIEEIHSSVSVGYPLREPIPMTTMRLKNLIDRLLMVLEINLYEEFYTLDTDTLQQIYSKNNEQVNVLNSIKELTANKENNLSFVDRLLETDSLTDEDILELQEFEKKIYLIKTKHGVTKERLKDIFFN